MRNDYWTVGEQLLSGVFMAFYILFLPFYGMYRLLRWFIVSVFKETGNRLVKYTGGAIALAIFVYVTQHLLQ